MFCLISACKHTRTHSPCLAVSHLYFASSLRLHLCRRVYFNLSYIFPYVFYSYQFSLFRCSHFLKLFLCFYFSFHLLLIPSFLFSPFFFLLRLSDAYVSCSGAIMEAVLLILTDGTAGRVVQVQVSLPRQRLKPPAKE